MAKGSVGMITRIIGPVVDVLFPSVAETPELFNAIHVKNRNGTLVLETLQELGNGEIRCIAMHSTDGLSRGMPAEDTGEAISVPVGEETLGRMINVTGDPIDNGGPIPASESRSIYHETPPFT